MSNYDTEFQFRVILSDDYDLDIAIFEKKSDHCFRYKPLNVDLYPTTCNAYFYKEKRNENIAEVLDRISELEHNKKATDYLLPLDRVLDMMWSFAGDMERESEKSYRKGWNNALRYMKDCLEYTVSLTPPSRADYYLEGLSFCYKRPKTKEGMKFCCAMLKEAGEKK